MATRAASLAPDYVRVFGQGEERVAPILAPEKNTDWDSAIDALDFTVTSPSFKNFHQHQNPRRGRDFYYYRPMAREQERRGKVEEAISVAGKLWKLTYDEVFDRGSAFQLKCFLNDGAP